MNWSVSMDRYDALRLENQLCFPLYAAAKEVVRLYTPHLTALDLTYTQYIAMMLVWDREDIAVKELGERLYLDTGTLTPLLRKLERKGLVTLQRDGQDRRSVVVRATRAGMALRERALDIPRRVGACLPLEMEELMALHGTLAKILDILTRGDGCEQKGNDEQ